MPAFDGPRRALECATTLVEDLRSLGLERHGLEWLHPEVDCAHPLDDGSAGVMLHSLEETADGLGEDGAAWRRIFGVARGFEAKEVELVRQRLEGTHWKRRLPTVAMVSPNAIGESYLRPVDY